MPIKNPLKLMYVSRIGIMTLKKRYLDWVAGFKSNSPLVEPGPTGGVLSVGSF